MITVHLMHNQMLVRQGLSNLLAKVPGLSISGESGNVADFFAAVRQGINADVILVALTFPELKNLDYSEVKNLTGSKVLIMACLEEGMCPSYALQPGADGYMLEDARVEEVVLAIKYLMDGKRYISSDIGLFLLKMADFRPPPENRVTLSSREKEILDLIGEGLTNQEIADKLFTSRRTVEGHRNSLLQKTGARNTAALIKFMMMGNINYD